MAASVALPAVLVVVHRCHQLQQEVKHTVAFINQLLPAVSAQQLNRHS
jgi:hypothetical protein